MPSRRLIIVPPIGHAVIGTGSDLAAMVRDEREVLSASSSSIKGVAFVSDANINDKTRVVQMKE